MAEKLKNLVIKKL